MSKKIKFSETSIISSDSNKKSKIDEILFDSTRAKILSNTILKNINENSLIEIRPSELIDKKYYLIINTETNNKIIGQFIKTFFSLSELMFIAKDCNMIIKNYDINKNNYLNKPVDIIRNNLLKKFEPIYKTGFKIYNLSYELELAYLVSNIIDK